MSEVPPPLDSERWERIEALFHQALELKPAQRAGFLDEACAGDTELRSALERFLAADTDPEALVDKSLASLALPLLTGPPSRAASPPLEPGELVGRYRVGEVLGSGGMGTVYRAERSDGSYQRQVALKVVRTGQLQEEAERRFRQERQILARLQHPGIATLLDGGVTDDGHPYLAMELVSGTPITEHAQAHQLDTVQRIELALQVIDAVEYAHRNLVVHRDLKPSNILVTEAGQLKLLDFGIARLLEDDGEEGATRTGLFLLTPEYAAPEQIRGEAITTATDVYALGAVLYELLTGRRPFGRVGPGWKELERVLTTDPPPISLAEGLDKSTRRALEGDVQTIVHKALQKEPQRRYASAAALAEDLRRHLSGRPVTATPDSLGYRVRKFVSRNRVASGLGAAVAVAVALGVAGTGWQARQARLEASRAQAVGEFLFSLFEGADPDLHPGEPVTASELLEAGLARVDSLDAGPSVRVDLLTTLGTLFGKLGHDARAEELLRQAVALSSESLGREHLATAKAMDALGVRLALTGTFEEARSVLAEALGIREAKGAPALEVGATRGNLARAMDQAGELDEAAGMYQEAINTLDAATGSDSLAFATELMGLAQTYEQNQRFEEADALMRAVRRLRETEGESPGLATAIHNLGHLTGGWKDDQEGAESLYREALTMRRRIYPAGHPVIPLTLQEIARVIQLRGRWSEADSLYEVALSDWTDLYGDEHPYLANLRANQANLRYRVGDLAAAAEAYQDVVRIFRLQGDPGKTSVSIHNLGVIQRERGNYAASQALLEESLEMRRAYLDEPHADIAQCLGTLALLHNLQGRFAEAEELARESVAQGESVLPPTHSSISIWKREIGVALIGQGRTGDALPILEDAHESLQEALTAADYALGRTRLWLGIAHARQGDRDVARALIESARPGLAGLRPDSPDAMTAQRELATLQR